MASRFRLASGRSPERRSYAPERPPSQPCRACLSWPWTPYPCTDCGTGCAKRPTRSAVTCGFPSRTVMAHRTSPCTQSPEPLRGPASPEPSQPATPCGSRSEAERVPPAAIMGRSAPTNRHSGGPAVAIVSASQGRAHGHYSEHQDRELHLGPLEPVDSPWNASAATVVRVCLHPRPRCSGGSISRPVTIRCAT